MKGRQYLYDKDEVTRGSRKRASNKPAVKKADHKHEYKEIRIIKDNIGNFHWEKVYLECVVCGKNKEETRHIEP